MKNKNNIIIVSFISIALLLFGGNLTNSRAKIESISPKIVAYVNDEPIELMEFLDIMNNEERGNLYNYFYQNYGVQLTSETMMQEINGEIPIHVLKEITLEKAIFNKIEQLMAKEAGLWDDISYSGLKENLIAYNSKRKNMADNNETIYGPIVYSSYEYYLYLLSDKKIQVIEEMKKNMTIDDHDLLLYYKANKDEYQMYDTIVTSMLYIDLDKQKDLTMEDASYLLNNVKQRLDGSLINGQGIHQSIQYMEYTFRPDNIMLDMKQYGYIMEDMTNNVVEGISDVFYINGKMMVYQIIDRINNEDIVLGFLKNKLYNDYINKEYEVLLKQNIDNAKVIINENIYDKIKEK
ncbi:hypothetical protein [Vallitalea maricola]|uniref:Uncharacterized protein n=1 Tax=Vallitalea maricola TaxID=3074433 RepID=A0ACB5UKP7_9FIRM|nr:hypothetical protein AN2V17_23580 [Vallitalea sp. AN17-2]